MSTYSRMLPGAAPPGVVMNQGLVRKIHEPLCLIEWEVLPQLVFGKLPCFCQ